MLSLVHKFHAARSASRANPMSRMIVRMAAIMACVAALLISIVFYSGRTMDSAARERESALVDNAFTGRLLNSIAEMRSVAWWDEAVVKTGPTGFDQEWIDMELGAFMTESYHHDRIMILDERDRPAYGFAAEGNFNSDAQAASLRSIWPLVEQARGGKNRSPRIVNTGLLSGAKEQSKATNRNYGRGAAAVTSVGGKPVLVTIMAITPSVDDTLTPEKPRLLVSFINVDNALLSTVGDMVLIKSLSFAEANDNRDGSLELRSDDGRALGDIRWESKRPGRDMVNKVLPWIIVALLIASAMLGWLLLRLSSSARLLAEREADAQHFANHDALTGLPNRRNLEAQLFLESGRTQDTMSRLSVAVVDLDRFKDINDTLGHHAGDQLIVAVGRRLRAELPQSDFIARLGGDEFAVLRICHELSDADQLTNQINTIFAEPFDVAGHKIEANASIGIAIAGFERAVDDLLREADIALYEAKARGRGGMVRFAPAMAKKIEDRRMLEVDLKHALGKSELTLHYQPIVEAATGTISSVEALVRWQSPKHGNVSPDIFVPIAEEAGLMAELGRFVIEQAVKDCQRWPQLSTAINISAAQLRSASILHDLLEPTRAQGVSPKQITLEITESMLMARDQRTLRTLNILKDSGFSLALDDFGTGYSSLSYIRDFPFDFLKIDRSFVTGLGETDRSLEIIKSIVSFGKILGRAVIAEGIETEPEMQAMQAAGVTHLQGYLFSKPLSAAHIEALVATSGRLTAARTAREDDADQGSAAGTTPAIRRIV